MEQHAYLRLAPRPQRDPTTPRKKSIPLYMSLEEHQALAHASLEAGVTMAEWVRHKTFGTPLPEREAS